MRRFTFVLFLLFIPFMVLAQEGDSIQTKELEAVRIEAQLQRETSQAMVVIPTRRQKLAAQNAVDLLRQLAMPQLNINLVNSAITTQTGAGVEVFINYLLATQEDINGLHTADVRRVEYLDFPTDARFLGKEHVVHFIVQKYEYGGYTKLSVRENFLVGLYSTAELYSKFSYKGMDYDLYAGAENQASQHAGVSTIGDYSLLNAHGAATDVRRKELVTKSRYREDAYPISLRAVYDSERVRISNLLGFVYQKTHTAMNDGELSYEPQTGAASSFSSDNPAQERLVKWSGYYLFALGEKAQLSFTPYAAYASMRDKREYTTSLPTEPAIKNDATEQQYNYGIEGSLVRDLAERQRVFLRLYYGSTHHDVRYAGTTTYDNTFVARFAGGRAGYNFSNQLWNFRADVALQWEENRINLKSIKDLYPVINLSAGFAPSSRHAFRTYFHYGANYPEASIKTPNVLKQNELMYFTGNPSIALSRQFTYDLSYSWSPSNWFAASVYGQYFGELNLYVPVFKHYSGGAALLRGYDSDAQYHRVKLGTSLQYKLLDGALQFAASPAMTMFRLRGRYEISENPFSGNISAVYYLKSFYFQLGYQTAFRTIQGNRVVHYEEPDFWLLQAGWSWNSLNVQLSANNLFRNDWLVSTERFESPLYSETRYGEGEAYHRRLRLSITYTFGYGKLVQQRNEISAQQGAQSAILK